MKNLIQSILVLIVMLRSTTGLEEVIYAQVGDTVTLPMLGTIQHHYVYWTFGVKDILQLAWCNPLGGKKFSDDMTTEWRDRLTLTDNSLIIKNIQQKNFGTFICKIEQKSGSTTTTITTTTYKVLKFNVSLSPMPTLLPGESLTLSCDIETHNGHQPQIYWLNPNKTKVDGNRGSSGGKLTVSATHQNNGLWTCVVTTNKKEYKATISVTIIDLSPAPSHPLYISKSSPLTIPCSILPTVSWEQIKAKGVQGVHWQFLPKPSSSLISADPQRLFSLSLTEPMTWTAEQDRKLSPAPNLRKGDLSLTRNQVIGEDRGDYMCTLEFKNDVTLKRTIHIEVLEIMSSAGTELISGQQINLTCSTGHVLPSDVRLKWVPPQPSSLQSLISDHHPACLIIPEVGTGDGGKWKCELWQNKSLLTSATITLKIKSKLSVWMLVTICGATVIVILICILVLILYRRRNRKIRHLRHRLCQCKNPKPKGFYRT